MVTLDRLVNVLRSYGVRMRFCPIPRSTELRSVILHEVAEERTVDTFLLGVAGAEYADLRVHSIESPLGAAIAGTRPGARRTYRLTDGTAMAVTLLAAAPYGLHTAALDQPVTS